MMDGVCAAGDWLSDGLCYYLQWLRNREASMAGSIKSEWLDVDNNSRGSENVGNERWD